MNRGPGLAAATCYSETIDDRCTTISVTAPHATANKTHASRCLTTLLSTIIE